MKRGQIDLENEIKRYRGIRIENDEDRIRAVGEFIHVYPQGLVADLADGYYVVTNKMAKHLKEVGIRYEEVELVDGVPKHVREFVNEQHKKNGVYVPF